ncbi:MAG TPA: hypothetical protein ENI64_01310 [Gammaproteobacteria bacterium]|nr:hypothetical protein [Gammaproteobacteria bacterium]
MPTHLPETVDPYRLAKKGESLSGDIAVDSMPRLSQILVEKEASVAVKLVFGYGEQRRLTISGTITTDLVLKCQRCLGPMPWPLQLEFTLVLVKAENQGEIPPEYEQYIMESDKIRLPEMIEDEILLSMPLVAKHATENCPAAGHMQTDTASDSVGQENGSETERKNPFDILKNLKSE